MSRVSLANTGIPTAAPPKREREEASPGPSEEEEITYEEAKRRAEERAEAALQCSIDNKEACMMCSG
jgi:ribonucleoside-diphosphate reductase subunit M1